VKSLKGHFLICFRGSNKVLVVPIVSLHAFVGYDFDVRPLMTTRYDSPRFLSGQFG
jgi:hypothetical protein